MVAYGGSKQQRALGWRRATRLAYASKQRVATTQRHGWRHFAAALYLLTRRVLAATAAAWRKHGGCGRYYSGMAAAGSSGGGCAGNQRWRGNAGMLASPQSSAVCGNMRWRRLAGMRGVLVLCRAVVTAATA